MPRCGRHNLASQCCVFGCFVWLSPLVVQLTADLKPEYNGESIFVLLSHTPWKINFNSPKQFQTPFCIKNTLLFYVNCEQLWYPLRTEFSHSQIYVWNMMCIVEWYLFNVSYLKHFHFSVFQNDYLNFFMFFGVTIFASVPPRFQVILGFQRYFSNQIRFFQHAKLVFFSFENVKKCFNESSTSRWLYYLNAIKSSQVSFEGWICYSKL